jgi:hypothetical protein
MRRRARAFRWILVAAFVVAVAAFVNVVLLRAAQEEDDRVGRLRPLLVVVTEPGGTETATGSTNGADTSPTQTINSTQTTTNPAAATTDDRGGGESGGNRGGHDVSSDDSERGGDDD